MSPILTPTGAIRAWWAVAMIVLASILASGASVGYAIHLQRDTERGFTVQQADAERRFRLAQENTERQSCGLLNILDKPLPADAPQRSKDIVREIHGWRLRAHCEKGTPQ